MDEEIRKIADHYGVEAQIGQTYEELGELIVALHKYQRKPCYDAYRNVVEEIADAMIMIEQVRALLGIATYEVVDVIDSKVARQIERIKAEEERYAE